MQETWFDPWVEKIPLEKGMPIHSSILTWRTPQTEEPSRPQSWGHKESDRTKQRSFSFSPLQKNLVNPWHEHLTLDEPLVKGIHGYHYSSSLGWF